MNRTRGIGVIDPFDSHGGKNEMIAKNGVDTDATTRGKAKGAKTHPGEGTPGQHVAVGKTATRRNETRVIRNSHLLFLLKNGERTIKAE